MSTGQVGITSMSKCNLGAYVNWPGGHYLDVNVWIRCISLRVCVYHCNLKASSHGRFIPYLLMGVEIRPEYVYTNGSLPGLAY